MRTMVREIDLRDPLPDLTAGEHPSSFGGALVLVRRHTVPLGYVRVDLTAGDPREALADALHEQLHRAVGDALGSRVEQLTAGVAATDGDCARLGERLDAIREGLRFSVVVCTCRRPARLKDCLEALRHQDYERFEVVVVDNTPGDPAVDTVLEELALDVPLRRVVEPYQGVSRARNAGVAVAAGEIVAFIDDDAIPDRHWVAELACGYRSVGAAAVVNGAIAPGALDTPAQEWFRQYGGHSKGRHFEQEVFDPPVPGVQSPLYPLPPFGAGGNMSFRREVLLDIGGFDEALGSGTPARGGEDTAAFTIALLRGHVIVFRPAALVWHSDRESYEQLEAQFHALGTSLSAYYTSLVLRDPRLLGPLARLLPRGLNDLTGGKKSLRTATMDETFPPQLLRAYRRGLVGGPFAYVRGRVAKRRFPVSRSTERR